MLNYLGDALGYDDSENQNISLSKIWLPDI